MAFNANNAAGNNGPAGAGGGAGGKKSNRRSSVGDLIEEKRAKIARKNGLEVLIYHFS